MGYTRTTNPLSALFSPLELRLLGLLFGQPRRRFQSAELMELAQGGTGGAHRVLTRLSEVGILAVTWDRRQKYYQANPASPIFPELCSLIAKTSGLAEPLEQALRPFAKKITAAFVYGPVGRKLESGVEIELVVISDEVDYPELILALNAAEAALGRRIVPVVIRSREWGTMFDVPDTMVWRIARQTRLFLIGSDQEVRVLQSLKWR
jgi:hypothetical protein